MKNIITYKSDEQQFRLDSSKASVLGVDRLDYETAIELLEKGYKIVIEGVYNDCGGIYNIEIPISIQSKILQKYKNSIIGFKDLGTQILIIKSSIIGNKVYVDIYSDRTFKYGIKDTFGVDYSKDIDRLKTIHKPMTNEEICEVITEEIAKESYLRETACIYAFKKRGYDRIVIANSLSDIVGFFFY